jgi:hypothetical protein
VAICRDCGEGKDNFRHLSLASGPAPYAYCKDCESERNHQRYHNPRPSTKAKPRTLKRPDAIPVPSDLSNPLRQAKSLPDNAARTAAAMDMGVPEGQLKQCKGCLRWKIGSVDYFEARPRNASGLAETCRVCRDDL